MARLPEHTIKRATGPLVMDGQLDEADWQAAPIIKLEQFPWYKDGEKQETIARVLWDDENLYLSWHCQDKHIYACETHYDGRVWDDDCVEVFTAPNPDKLFGYYTFEINCVGTMLNRCMATWNTQPEHFWQPQGVVIGHSIPGPTKDEGPEDKVWVNEVAIPLRNFARDAAHTPPEEGDFWRLNLQRCGGRTNRQQCLWSYVEDPPRAPNFHWPPNFGIVKFSRTPVR